MDLLLQGEVGGGLILAGENNAQIEGSGRVSDFSGDSRGSMTHFDLLLSDTKVDASRITFRVRNGRHAAKAYFGWLGSDAQGDH